MLKKLIRGVRDRAIERLPSRIFLARTVVPALAADQRRRMLAVGTRSYVRPFYQACTEAGIAVWSIDLDPAAAEHGAPAGHMIGNICDIESLAAGKTFDVILFNGVLGWGLDDADEAVRALEAMKKVAEPGAVILVGWNPGRTSGAEVRAVQQRLGRTVLGSIPAEIVFAPAGRAQRHPHRYELFTLA